MAAFGYGAGMKRWKGVLGLAIIGAVAAPFVIGTWQPRPNAQVWIALTPEGRATLRAKIESSKNCRYLETQVEARDALGLTPDPDDILEAIQCHREQDALRDGGKALAYFSLSPLSRHQRRHRACGFARYRQPGDRIFVSVAASRATARIDARFRMRPTAPSTD